MMTVVAADAEAVRALVVTYAERLDAGDLDGVAALFGTRCCDRPARAARLSCRGGAPDVRPGGPLHERDASHPARAEQRRGDPRPVGGARAASRCVFTVFQARPGSVLGPVLAGRYDDRFERVAGEWRFTERVITPDLVGDLSDHMRR